MNKPIFLSFLLILILLISHCSAVTIVNSRYSSGLVAGAHDVFSMTLKADTEDEIGMPLTIGMDSGNASSWVKLDQQTITLTAAGTPVRAEITIPKDAYNGFYQGRVQYTAPLVGMVQSRIEAPISINVTGGKLAPVLIVQKTEEPTSAPVMEAPAQQQQPEIPIIKTSPEEEMIAGIPLKYFTATALIIAGVFGVVLIYDYRRGKK